MWAGEWNCAFRGQGNPSEHPPISRPNSDLRLILSTGQGEIAKPLRCKTSPSLSVWLPPPHPLPTPCLLPPLWSVPSRGAHCEPIRGLFFLCLSGLLARGSGRGGGRRGGEGGRGNQGPDGWAPESLYLMTASGHHRQGMKTAPIGQLVDPPHDSKDPSYEWPSSLPCPAQDPGPSQGPVNAGLITSLTLRPPPSPKLA